MAGMKQNDTEIHESIQQMEQLSKEMYDYIYGDWLSHSLYLVDIVTVLILGPIFGMTLALFERFGADSQKRTMINRLFSFTLINFSILSFGWGILRLLRDRLGLLSTKLYSPLSIIYMWLDLSSGLLITEITVIRFLYIVVWKRMKVINDEFWTSVVSISTYLITFYIILMHHIIGDHGLDTGKLILVFSPHHTR